MRHLSWSATKKSNGRKKKDFSIMSNIVSGTYYATYNDFDGIDEVPCEMDLDVFEVTSFFTPISWRRADIENGFSIIVEETVVLEDGTKYEALERNDTSFSGGVNDYAGIVIYDMALLQEAVGL